MTVRPIFGTLLSNMICFLSGIIEYRGNGFVVLNCNGIGYKIIVPGQDSRSFSGDVSLYVHEITRDNQHDFFGFAVMPDLELFWQLIDISGVGPKSAQKIVYAGGASKAVSAIMGGDLTFLTAVQGIGKKTAQKIILELSGKLATDPEDEIGFDSDALDALIGLGYTKREAQKALSGIEADTTEEKIRLVLKGVSI